MLARNIKRFVNNRKKIFQSDTSIPQRKSIPYGSFGRESYHISKAADKASTQDSSHGRP